MMKLMIVGRRARGRTRDAAQAHLRDIHGRKVVCAPGDAGAMPADYVQNHVIDGAYPGTGAHAIERDLVTELWFESVAALCASTSTPYYLAELRPDEPRFVDDPTVAKMRVRAVPHRDGGGGPFKAFWLLGGGSEAAQERVLAAFLALPGLGRAVGNDVLPPPDGSARFVDLVLEGWFEARDRAVAAVERFAGVLAELAPAAAERSFAVAAEEHDTDRLRAHLGCPAHDTGGKS